MLRALLELFYQPMLREGFFQESELATIFPSLEDLLDVHAVFLESLKKRREESGFIITHIGDLLLARFDGAEGRWFQKISARFCSRQSLALEQLKAKQRRDARFCHFVAEAEAQPRCRRLQLKDMIPIEMQRLTKYPLLLHSVTACTEEVEERSRVQQAAECCREILNHVNREVRDMENLMKLKDYQRRLDLSNLKQCSDPLLSDFKNVDITKRTLLHEGALTWRVSRDKSVEVQALLLDEVLMLLQRVEERLVLRPHSRGPAPPDGRRLLSPIVPLRSAMARQVATDPRAFYVISSWEQGAQIYELGAASVAERKAWCLALTDAAGALRPPLTAHSRPKAPGGGGEKESSADPHLKEAPPSDGLNPTERGELLRAAMGRVAAIRQLLAEVVSPTEGDQEPPPGDGEGTGGGSEGPAHNGASPAPSGPAPSLAPPPAARVEAELQGLEATLGALKALEDDYWRLRELLRRESGTT
ncbi:rho guanine nucleotide exchange factor 1 [Numida meleagris]|uniref:rho guanine nucleotide exchange factor 1 n=1 Tax=Numida meleagris TaxID=8996 RepID=UPI000B3DB5FA|nr:rho guanine nucleotide exchange factor 1 [Numida meleagris]